MAENLLEKQGWVLRCLIRNPVATTFRPGLPDPVSTDNPDETFQVLATLGFHGRKRKHGQHLSQAGISECSDGKDGKNIDVIIKAALDRDLKHISVPFLPKDINRGKLEKVSMNHVSFHFIPARLWKGFKSLDNKKEHSETDKQFEETRKAAIREITKTAITEGKTKQFGGGSAAALNFQKEKQNQRYQTPSSGGVTGVAVTNTPSNSNVSSNSSNTGIYRQLSSGVDDNALQRLVEMGFPREQSITALKEHSDDVDAALNSLLSSQKQSTNPRQDRGGSGRGGSGGRGRGRGKGRGRNRDVDDDDYEEDDMQSKPSGRTTLFDFLESQLGPAKTAEKSKPEQNMSQFRNDTGGYKQQDRYERDNRDYDNKAQRGRKQYGQNDQRSCDRQPQSVRDAGIAFVHGKGEPKPNRESNDYAENRSRGGRSSNQYQRYNDQPRRNNDDSRPPRDYSGRQDRYHNDRYQQSKQEQYSGSTDSFSGKPSNTNRRQNSAEGYGGEQRTNNRQDTRYNRYDDRHKYQQQQNHFKQDWNQENRERDNRRRDAPGSAPSVLRTQPPVVSNPVELPTQVPLMQQPPLHPTMHWRNGDKCLAKYWEDKKFYPAIIHAVDTKLPTAVVYFTEYGNYEEIFASDIKPLPASAVDSNVPPTIGGKPRVYENFEGPVSGVLEFRHGGGGNYRRQDPGQYAPQNKERRPPTKPQQQYYQPPGARK
uniref:Tudor domain-containing protein 3-like n=1 Tax=Saccoglossus kowalevskii TaxID=10224 RepID=A0ABM0MFL0_SACKO|nr:PREDICTED: tudor domain-containing protein 3-like [Saccoglossus kowalevskii]